MYFRKSVFSYPIATTTSSTAVLNLNLVLPVWLYLGTVVLSQVLFFFKIKGRTRAANIDHYAYRRRSIDTAVLKFSAPCTAIYLEPSTRVLHVHLVHVIYGITSTVVYPLNLAPEGTFESMEKQLVVLNLVLLRNYQIY
jgi:hypothetical protein